VYCKSSFEDAVDRERARRDESRTISDGYLIFI
jgi:hypothetical protein